jgi:hypothetical protein
MTKLEAKTRLLATSAASYFDPALISDAKTVDYKDRSKVIDMEIKDFLKMALPLKRGPMADKMEQVQLFVKHGKKLSSLPQLFFDCSGETAKVTGHEGRHRALALQEAGCKSMPVEIRGPIRWSEQDDPDRFDYREEWPTVLISEDGSSRMLFPVTRETSNEGYKP